MSYRHVRKYLKRRLSKASRRHDVKFESNSEVVKLVSRTKQSDWIGKHGTKGGMRFD